MLKLAMLSTGEEVLHGDIVDTNASWLSGLLFEEGFSLSKRSTVGDSHQALTEELILLTLNSDVLIVNGGLGPTSDDVTTEVAANVAGVELELFPDWLEQMNAFFATRNQVMPDSNVKQAMLPAGSTFIDNPIGTACGFQCVINECLCYFTPGVPSEFKRMVVEQIVPDLQHRFPELVGSDCHRIYTVGSSESELAQWLETIPLPPEYQLGYRSYIPFIEIKVFGPKGDYEGALELIEQIRDKVEDKVVSIDQTMLTRLGDCVAKTEVTLALAEQSTRGWLSNWLFSDPSISEARGSCWILSSHVAGAMDDKDALSAALALAAATKEKSATDIAIATGEYRNRTFTLALSTPYGEWAQSHSFNRDYSDEDSKIVIGTIAADMLLRYLTGKPVFGEYRFSKTIKKIYLPIESLK
ncbi:CinA family nicotinamide mononucleotide deamidase-related protein [Vibrio sp. RC27]